MRPRLARKTQSGFSLIDLLFVMFILCILALIIVPAIQQDDPPDKTGFIRAAKRDYCKREADRRACLRHDFRQVGLERYCTEAIDSRFMRNACIARGHAWSLVFVRYGAVERDAERICARFDTPAEGEKAMDPDVLGATLWNDAEDYLFEVRRRTRAGLEKPAILPDASRTIPHCPNRTGGIEAPLPSG